jgi:hypothetical protein
MELGEDHTPKLIEELNTDIEWDSTAFADMGGSFRNGNQWGPQSYASLGQALRLGVTADNYGYFDTSTTGHFSALQRMKADTSGSVDGEQWTVNDNSRINKRRLLSGVEQASAGRR